MENLEVKQILNDTDENSIKTIINWMYNWWRVEFKKYSDITYEEVESYVRHSLEKNRLPQTYGLFLDGKIIGTYQFIYDDLDIRPDIYPWFANFYIDCKYRGNGYAKFMLDTVKSNAKKLNLKELYIYTKHIGLYEKIGFKYISDIDTIVENVRIQRLYKLEIK